MGYGRVLVNELRGVGHGHVAGVESAEYAKGVGAVVGVGRVGCELLHLVAEVSLVAVSVDIVGIVDGVEVAETRRTVGVEEVEVVGVDALVYDAGDDAFAGVWPVETLRAGMDGVKADSGFAEVHVGVGAACNLHDTDSAIESDVLGVVDGHEAQGDVAAHGEHLDADFAEVVGGISVVEADERADAVCLPLSAAVGTQGRALAQCAALHGGTCRTQFNTAGEVEPGAGHGSQA